MSNRENPIITMNILRTSLVVAFCGAFSFQQIYADSIKDVDSLIKEGLVLRDTFNSAVSNANVFYAVLADLKTNSNKTLSDFNSINKNLFSAENKMDSLRSRLDSLKTSIDADIEKLKLTGELLNKTAKSLPIGDSKIKEIEDLIAETRQKVELNTGDNYQDKKYFDSIVSSFDSARRSFNNAVSEVSRVSALSSVNTPRIDGMKSTIAMIEDYQKKTNSEISKNSTILKSLEPSVKKIVDICYKESSRFADIEKKYDASMCVVLSSFFDVSTLVLNSVPLSQSLKNNLNFELNSLSGATAYSTDLEWKRPSVMKNETPVSASVSRLNSAWSAPAKFKSSLLVSEPKNIRAEILSVCSRIAETTRHLNSACVAISKMTQNANVAINDIVVNESELSRLLKDSITEFSEAQVASSKILLFKIYIDTTSAQNQISITKLNIAFNDSTNGFTLAKKSASELSAKTNGIAKSTK